MPIVSNNTSTKKPASLYWLHFVLAACAWALQLEALAAPDQVVQAHAPPPHTFVRAHFMDAQGNLQSQLNTYVAEKVILVVDAYSNTWFAKSPEFADFTVEDAISTRVEKFATNFTEVIERQSYSVQRREYLIYPERSGGFVVPGIDITVTISGTDKQPLQEQILRSNPLMFFAEPLPDNPFSDTAPRRVLSAENVSVEEAYSVDDAVLRLGDVLEREIKIKAQGALGMLIPAPTWPAVAGVRQQSSVNRVRDQNVRGELLGKYSVTRSYTFERTGAVTLPPLKFYWWNSLDKSWQQSTLPGHKLNIEMGSLQSGISERQSGLQLRQGLENGLALLTANLLPASLLLLGIFLSGLLAYYRHRIARRWWLFWSSERGYYYRLMWALLRRRDSDILSCYYRWHDRCSPLSSADIALPEHIDAIFSALYSGSLAARRGAILNVRQRKMLCYFFKKKRNNKAALTHSKLMPLNP